MNKFKVGDIVQLTLDSPGTVGIVDGLRAHKDKEFIVSRFVLITPPNKKPGSYGFYYELAGCVSRKGVPYGITEDWLKLRHKVLS